MKKVIALLSIILVFSLASCGFNETDHVFENINDEFVLLTEAEIPSTLPAPYKAGEGFYEEITGNGVLFGNKKSEISIKATDGMSAVITIDGKQFTIYAEGLEGAQIVDLDTSDNLHELAIYSAGPSMDPTISFIHFDGEKISPIHFTDNDLITSFVQTSMYGYHGGTEDDVNPTYGAVYTNKQGKIINSMQYTGFSNPRFVLSYYELEGDILIRKELSTDNLPIPVTVKARGEIQVFFTPMDNPPENFEASEFFNNFENPKVIHPEEEFKILGFGKCYNYYAFFVEIENETGVITFWTGD